MPQSFNSKKVDWVSLAELEEDIQNKAEKILENMSQKDKTDRIFTDVQVIKEHMKTLNGSVGDHESRLRDIENVVNQLKGTTRFVVILCGCAGGMGGLITILTKIAGLW